LILLFFFFGFEILAKIYFRTTGETGRSEGGEKTGETFPAPHTGDGSKDSLVL
jgi:hypothetical protein